VAHAAMVARRATPVSSAQGTRHFREGDTTQATRAHMTRTGNGAQPQHRGSAAPTADSVAADQRSCWKSGPVQNSGSVCRCCGGVGWISLLAGA